MIPGHHSVLGEYLPYKSLECLGSPFGDIQTYHPYPLYGDCHVLWSTLRWASALSAEYAAMWCATAHDPEQHGWEDTTCTHKSNEKTIASCGSFRVRQSS